MKGYCIGYGALHSPSSSVSAAGDIWDSRGCVWSVAPCCLSPGWSREPLPAAAAAAPPPRHDYNCKGDNTEKMSTLVLQNLLMMCLIVCECMKVPRQASSPHDLVFFTTVASSVFAVVVIVQKQSGLLLVAPLQHLALGLTVWWGVFVFQVPWFAVEGVGDEAQIPFLIFLETDWHYTWKSVRGRVVISIFCSVIASSIKCQDIFKTHHDYMSIWKHKHTLMWQDDTEEESRTFTDRAF